MPDHKGQMHGGNKDQAVRMCVCATAGLNWRWVGMCSIVINAGPMGQGQQLMHEPL